MTAWELHGGQHDVVVLQVTQPALTFVLFAEVDPRVAVPHLTGREAALRRGIGDAARAAERASLQLLQSLLHLHLRSFPHEDPGTAWRQRQQLAAKLGTLFRAFRYQSAAIFCHLLLVALDVERLRGDILQRRLFPNYREDNA